MTMARLGVFLVIAANAATSATATQLTYTSLPLPVPDNRPDDQTAAVAAEAAFLATLDSYGTETYDEITGAGLGATASQALTFGPTTVTGVAAFSGVFTLPALPTVITTPNALVDQPAASGQPAYQNDIMLNQAVTAFGTYIIQAGDQAADTITLRLENTLVGSSRDVVVGTVGPNANFNNVFYFGITDNFSFDKITVLTSDGSDGILLDNTTIGFVRVPEPGTLVLLVLGSALPMVRHLGRAKRRNSR